MNGRIISLGGGNKKNRQSRIRPWHIAKTIAPVKMDEMFQITGSDCPAEMMYPGDLNGGACNVANCRCWMMYNNEKPIQYKNKGTYQINTENISNNKKFLNNKLINKKENKKSLKNKTKILLNKLKNNFENVTYIKNKGFINNVQNQQDIPENNIADTPLYDDIIIEDSLRSMLPKDFSHEV